MLLDILMWVLIVLGIVFAISTVLSMVVGGYVVWKMRGELKKMEALAKEE